MAAIKSSDNNLAKVLAALKAKNVLAKTDIFVVSDHGFSTYLSCGRCCGAVARGGFRRGARLSVKKRIVGRYSVVSLGGSVTFYVVDR
jgi:arylsulfatase A-like enzyme